MNKKIIKTKSPYLIGITGSFGVGKSLVGEMLIELGVTVIDTDHIVKDILKNKNIVTRKILKLFGPQVRSKQKGSFLDRSEIAKIVFNNELAKKKLEKIVHPEVNRLLLRQLSKLKKKKVVAVLIPLLFEAKREKMYDEIWCITCNQNIQLQRLNKKGFSRKAALARIKGQLPQQEKMRRADFVINNSGSILKTKKQVLKVLFDLRLQPYLG